MSAYAAVVTSPCSTRRNSSNNRRYSARASSDNRASRCVNSARIAAFNSSADRNRPQTA